MVVWAWRWISVVLSCGVACDAPRTQVTMYPQPLGSVSTPTTVRPHGAAFSVPSIGWTSAGAMDADAIYVGNDKGVFAYARADGKQRVVTTEPASIHALASDRDALYWFSKQHDVVRVLKSGGDVTTVAATQFAHGDPIVADAHHVYWACWGSHAFSGMALYAGASGEAPKRLAEIGQIDPNEVRSLAIDDGQIYIGLKAAGSAVLVVPESGGTPAPFGDAHAGYGIVDAFAFDAERVYWIDNERKKVFWRAKRGGAPAELASVTDFGVSIVVAGAYVYWGDWGQHRREIQGTVQRVPKAGGKAETLVTAPEQAAWVAVDGLLYWFGSRVVEARALP